MSNERYVVTTYTPYKWSAGPSASMFDTQEAAQEAAERALARSGERGNEDYIQVAIGLVSILN